MNNDWKQEPKLQLIVMDISQNYTPTSQQHCNQACIQLVASSPTHCADDWGDSWGENIGGDEFVNLEDFVDTDLDSDIIDFSIDEY